MPSLIRDGIMNLYLSIEVQNYLGLNLDKIEVEFHSIINEGFTSGYMRAENLNKIHIALNTEDGWYDKHFAYTGMLTSLYSPIGIREMAITVIHELTHIRQFREIDHLDATKWLEAVAVLKRGKYSERPLEIEAREYENNAPEIVINHVMASLGFMLTNKYRPWFHRKEG